MKKIIPTIVFLLFAGAVFSQDYIYKKDGSDIAAKVIEITPDLIKYKRFNFQDGPVYSVKISEVNMIAYEGGQRERFNETVEPSPAAEVLSQAPEAAETPAAEIPVNADTTATNETPELASAETPEVILPEPEKSRSAFRVGFTAGVNAATRITDYKVGANPPDNSYRLAPAAGFTFDLRIWRKFYLQSSLLYKGKGDRIDMGLWTEEFSFPEVGSAVWEVEADGFTTTTLHYAELSLMPVFGIGDEDIQFQIGAGGYVAYGISGKEKRDYTISYYLDYELDSEEIVKEEKTVKFVGLIQSEDNPDEIYLKSVDYGLLFYAGLRLSDINLGAYLAKGYQQLEQDEDNLFVSEAPVVTSKNFTWTLAMTYFF